MLTDLVNEYMRALKLFYRKNEFNYLFNIFYKDEKELV